MRWWTLLSWWAAIALKNRIGQDIPYLEPLSITDYSC
jgi:hypothetical protein